ncbi:MAG: hypothetical protein JRC87_04415 [Deltaproteobacteria bacterium]|nr:hypothetical protein [Deltaproteobacteria bacterium]
MAKSFPLLFFTLLFLTFSGCSSTKLVQSWSETNFEGQPLKRILVIGIMRGDQQRRIYEDTLVTRLKAAGINGVAGYTLISDTEDYNDKAIIKVAVRKSGADSALIATLVSVKEKERHVPPSVYYEPMYGYRHGFYDYYGMSHRAVYSPGYTTIDTVVKLETTVFTLSPEKMIWAGTTESFNPPSPLKIIEENADIIIKSMKASNML